MHYKATLANYPQAFKGYVVSPTKICIQFNGCQVKLRPLIDINNFSKHGPNNDRIIPIATTGTDIEGIAVGCQLPVVEEYQLGLLDAYEEYYNKYKEIYSSTYNKNFKDFILNIDTKVKHLLSLIDQPGVS